MSGRWGVPERREEGRWRLGFQPVREILRSQPHRVAEVLISRSAGDRRRTIEGLCERHRVRVRSVAPGELRARLVEAGQDQAAARGFAASLVDAERGGTSAAAIDPGLVVLLEDVQDPRNLGALLRVCEGAGVGRVLIRDRGAAPLSPAAAGAAAGAVDWLTIERITNSAREIERLKQEGFWVYGADAAGEPPWTVDLSGPVVVCIGGEARGLRRRTRSLCDGLLGLPMRGRVESLNLSTAAAALLYEAVRQRA
ncbi:MAG: RNA methyltransferase [Holophagales bacterium]|nr:RNA methyltransferase [Holophagales bacterium]MYH24136.1 RNA methyltransferase [Holophagales bacterium]